jgi:hypothetical protein
MGLDHNLFHNPKAYAFIQLPGIPILGEDDEGQRIITALPGFVLG